MAKDNHEAINVPEKAVEKEKHRNENKEEDERNKCDADSAEMRTLDEEIKKHAEHDQDESIKHKMNLNELK